ncbi:MAG: helix-turn-helix domain-containing protein [Janthinobacterium lividum]
MADTSADAIMHPVRIRILMTLTGQQLTTHQIGMALPEIAQATLYRHMSRLVKAEVVTVVDQRPVRGVMEKVYALAGNGVSVSLDPSQMEQEDWRHAFAAFTASLMGQFGVYIQQEQADPAADGISFRTAPLYLDDAELKQFFADLSAIVVPAMSQGPAPGRRRRLLSTILIPDVNLTSNDEHNENGELQ